MTVTVNIVGYFLFPSAQKSKKKIKPGYLISLGGIIVALFILLWFAPSVEKNLQEMAQTQLQTIPLVKERVGSVQFVNVTTSQNSPLCTDQSCKDITRLAMNIIGDKGQLKASADFNITTEHFYHIVFCEQNGILAGWSNDISQENSETIKCK